MADHGTSKENREPDDMPSMPQNLVDMMTSVTKSLFVNLESHHFVDDTDARLLVREMFRQPEVYYYYFEEEGTTNAVIQEAKERGWITFPTIDRHYYRHPRYKNDFIQITPRDKYTFPWEELVVKKGPRFSRFHVRIGAVVQRQLESAEKIEIVQLHQDALLDRKFMLRAIELARKCTTEPGKDKPSPKVGAVVVRNGKILGEAYRGEPFRGKLAPGDHAEFVLLEKKLKDKQLAGATLYTTLEPCTRRGTGKVPCAERIIDRRLKRVVIGALDPDESVSGKGQMRLQDAGIETALFDPDLAQVITELDREFRRQRKAERDTTQPVSVPDKQFVRTLTGVRDHARRMADVLVEKKSAMSPMMYQQHLDTVFVAAGNGIQRARAAGAFDDQIDLLNILDGVEQGEYAWQTGNLACDRFHGFWYWTKAHDDPGFDERGDYQPYALKRLAEVIDSALIKRDSN
jgi:pyrimidine deaminase RibD-like protein